MAPAQGDQRQSLRTSLPQEDVFHPPTPGAGLRLPPARSTPRGYANYRNTTRGYLAPVFKVPLLQFGEDDVRVLLSALTKRAPQCVRSAKSVLSCAFEWGKEHFHGVKANPCKGVKVMVKKGERKRFLSDWTFLARIRISQLDKLFR